MAFLKNALMCIKKVNKVKLTNHDCLHISMMLHIMLAYLMLLAALSNADVPGGALVSALVA